MPGEPTCREFVETVTDLLDDALDPEQRRRVEEHLAGCDPCTVHLEQVRATVRITARSGGHEALPAATEDQLAAMFRAWSTTHADPR